MKASTASIKEVFPAALDDCTTTASGLTVKAKLDRRRYPTNVKVPNATMATISIKPRRFHGEWNYKIAPRNDR